MGGRAGISDTVANELRFNKEGVEWYNYGIV